MAFVEGRVGREQSTSCRPLQTSYTSEVVSQGDVQAVLERHCDR
jgi:hypothetical protein